MYWPSCDGYGSFCLVTAALWVAYCVLICRSDTQLISVTVSELWCMHLRGIGAFRR